MDNAENVENEGARETGNDTGARMEFVCAVCGRVLDYKDSDEGRVYMHTVWDANDADHRVVPVPLTENPDAIERCDFCHVDHPAWRVPVREFNALPGHMSTPDWLACDDCAEIINRGRWNELTRRATKAWEDRHGGPIPPEMTTSLMALYRKVRKNQMGAPRPNK